MQFKKYVLIALLALFSFGDLVYAQDSMTMQVTSERYRNMGRNNSWGNWSEWMSSNSIIYFGEDEDGDLAFYVEDGENSENDLYFIITYASDPTYDSNGGEHMTAKVTEIHSGNRGTLVWYTYPSGDRNQFTLRFPKIEIQYRTKDL